MNHAGPYRDASVLDYSVQFEIKLLLTAQCCLSVGLLCFVSLSAWLSFYLFVWPSVSSFLRPSLFSLFVSPLSFLLSVSSTTFVSVRHSFRTYVYAFLSAYEFVHLLAVVTLCTSTLVG